MTLDSENRHRETRLTPRSRLSSPRWEEYGQNQLIRFVQNSKSEFRKLKLRPVETLAHLSFN